MQEGLQKQFLENRFVGMMFILIASTACLVFGYIDQDIWNNVSLFSFGIFSGSKAFDAGAESLVRRAVNRAEKS